MLGLFHWIRMRWCTWTCGWFAWARHSDGIVTDARGTWHCWLGKLWLREPLLAFLWSAWNRPCRVYVQPPSAPGFFAAHRAYHDAVNYFMLRVGWLHICLE